MGRRQMEQLSVIRLPKQATHVSAVGSLTWAHTAHVRATPSEGISQYDHGLPEKIHTDRAGVEQI